MNYKKTNENLNHMSLWGNPVSFDWFTVTKLGSNLSDVNKETISEPCKIH